MKNLIVEGILRLIAYSPGSSFALLMTLLIYFLLFNIMFTVLVCWVLTSLSVHPFFFILHYFLFIIIIILFFNNLTVKQAPSQRNQRLPLLPTRVCFICLESASYFGFAWILCLRKKKKLLILICVIRDNTWP